LEEWGAPAYKIASNEFTDWPLVKRAAETGKPLILSTGTATLEEIEATTGFLARIGAPDYALLHCVSAYPAPLTAAHLNTITAIAERFGVVAGFSDHTLGVTAPIVAAALGASIIEKHFILDRSDGGPDSSFAIEPDELALLCRSVKDAHDTLGDVRFGMKEAETKSPIYKRCFYTTRRSRRAKRWGRIICALFARARACRRGALKTCSARRRKPISTSMSRSQKTKSRLEPGHEPAAGHLWGSGEIASLAKYYFEQDGGREVAAFTVDDDYASDEAFEGTPLLAWSEAQARFSPAEADMHVALSYQKLNRLRQAKYEQAKAAGYTLASYVCSKASVWPDLSPWR
jgi:hypothetical protein